MTQRPREALGPEVRLNRSPPARLVPAPGRARVVAISLVIMALEWLAIVAAHWLGLT